MAPGLFADQPFAPATTTIAAQHLGIGSRLIDKDQLLGIKACLAGLPVLARLSYVRPILFGGVQSFF